jgi:hypothetical protein
MSEIGYPSFIQLFRQQPECRMPLYSYLLHMQPDARFTLREIVASLARSADPDREICALLNGLDWREHLVGALASILGRRQSSAVITAHWNAFDEGSWVSPQLAVVLSLIDPSFAQQSRDRIECRCLGVPDRTHSVSMLLRTVVSGPAGGYHRACKALSALCVVSKRFPELRQWLKEQKQQPDVQRMLSDDPDSGGMIAFYWQEACIQLCQECVRDSRQTLIN